MDHWKRELIMNIECLKLETWSMNKGVPIFFEETQVMMMGGHRAVWAEMDLPVIKIREI